MSQASMERREFYSALLTHPNQVEILMTAYELGNRVDSSAMERIETKTVVKGEKRTVMASIIRRIRFG